MPRFKLSHPDEVDAIQFTGDNAEDVSTWLYKLPATWGIHETHSDLDGLPNRIPVVSKTDQRDVARIGNWLVYDECGSIVIMSDLAFHATYESAESGNDLA